MTQIDMFNDTVKNGKRDIEVSQAVLDARDVTLAIRYADEYILKNHFGEKIGTQWIYTQDKYKLLHYIMQFGLGEKQSIPGWELSNIMFNHRNTEKLRGMVNDLRNDCLVDVVIGSSSKGYFIAKQKEIYDAVKYIFAKSVNEMVTAIKMYPPLFEKYIKIAQRTYQDTDKSHDSQITAQFDDLTDKLLDEIVIRYADTMKYESKKNT
jgi:hypothetical protein